MLRSGNRNTDDVWSRNIQGRSCDHYFSGKAKSIAYSDCVFVALGIQHAMRMRYTIIYGLPGCTIFFCIALLTEYFRKKIIMKNKLCVFVSITTSRMTGQNYLYFLQNELPKQLENIPLATRIAICFQLDGAPSHYTRHVIQHLNDTFPSRWIGRGSTNNWPPKSPDLTPLDFCLRGLMKSEVYRKKVDTRDELLVNILDVIACIKGSQDALRRTSRHVFTRVAKCIDVDGGIFEHLL